ncbi:non-specific serine/threonine protein kinase [Plasmodiophora brassicae]
MSGGRGDAITFPELDGEYEVLRVVSRGTFSTVYLARLRAHPDRHVALKRVMRTSAPERTANEVECLIMAGGRCNVCPILHANRFEDQVTLVLQYFPHDDFKDYFDVMTLDEIQAYMWSLFEALECVHSLGIIHRDVKPSNFLYNRDAGRFQLIDFGLAQQVSKLREKGDRRAADPGGPRVPLGAVDRAGTRGFRAPEVLLLVKHQTVAIDIWSAGAILLCIITGRYPFFQSADDMTAIAEMAAIFGSTRLREAAASLNRSISLPERIPARSWRDLRQFLDGGSRDDLPDTLFDLLDRCLEPKPGSRITAAEALKHPFFNT